MKFRCENEAVQRAVAIIESLIEVTVKNDAHEMTEQLREVRLLLIEFQNGFRIDSTVIQTGLSLVKYIIEVLHNS